MKLRFGRNLELPQSIPILGKKASKKRESENL